MKPKTLSAKVSRLTIFNSLTAKVPRLMIFNPKGGVGKTALALNFALTYGYGLVTNDRLSIVDQVLPDEQYMILTKDEPLPDIPVDWPVVFDFGGYPDRRVLDALKLSQFIIIPVLPHRENVQTSLEFIKEIKTYKEEKNIIVVINQTAGQQFQDISEAIKHFYPAIAVFNLKKSTAFTWLTEQKKSIAELVETNKLQARHFQPVSEQFNLITERLLNKNRFVQTSFIKK